MGGSTISPTLVLLAFSWFFLWAPKPAIWFQPTAVGMMWAAVFLSGCMVGGPSRGNSFGALTSGLLAYLAMAAFAHLAEIGVADSLMLSSLLAFVGWLAAWWDPRSGPAQRNTAWKASGGLRWGIWDLGFLTILAACLCHAIPRLESAPPLLFSIILALVAGMLCSWMACRWVWQDQWSLNSLGLLGLCLAGGTSLVFFSGPPALSTFETLTWLIGGPINVIAAQGLTVLTCLALWRWERRRPVVA